MSDVQAPDRAVLEELARRFEAAGNDFPAVDAIVFFRPDKRDEELKREARRILVPRPNPVAAEYDPALLKQFIDEIHRAGLLDRLSDGGIDAAFRENLRAVGIDADLFERLYTFDDSAERRRQFDGERAAQQAAMDWETLIPPNGRLVTDEHGGEIWRYAMRDFHDGHLRHLWQFHLVGNLHESKPDPRSLRFEMLAYEAYRLLLAKSGRGDSPASSWLIYLADRAEPLRPSPWPTPADFVRDQRTVLDYGSLFHGRPMWGRSASQTDKGGGRKVHEWWAARLPNIFWLSALAVRHSAEVGSARAESCNTIPVRTSHRGPKCLAEKDPARWQAYVEVNKAKTRYGGWKKAEPHLKNDSEFAVLRKQLEEVGEIIGPKLFNNVRQRCKKKVPST